MREAVTRLRDEASQAGRNPQDITISFRAPLAFANDDYVRRAGKGQRLVAPAPLLARVLRVADFPVV